MEVGKGQSRKEKIEKEEEASKRGWCDITQTGKWSKDSEERMELERKEEKGKVNKTGNRKEIGRLRRMNASGDDSGGGGNDN